MGRWLSKARAKVAGGSLEPVQDLFERSGLHTDLAPTGHAKPFRMASATASFTLCTRSFT